jgi:hypothetical protein
MSILPYFYKIQTNCLLSNLLTKHYRFKSEVDTIPQHPMKIWLFPRPACSGTYELTSNATLYQGIHHSVTVVPSLV